MFAVLLVPLGNAGRLVHVLDNLPPADSRVVGAEGNFAQLGGVRDDAHFRASEVVVEEILEPHSGDEQEVPRILAPLLDILEAAFALDLAVVLTRQTEGLVELL